MDGCEQPESVYRPICKSVTRLEKNECGRETSAPARGHRGLTAALLRDVLRTHSRGAVEIAFDNQSGYIIVEGIAAQIYHSVTYTYHHILPRTRRTPAT